MYPDLHKELATFERRTPKSDQAHKRNLKRIPLGVASACVIDQNASHQLRRNSKKMSSALPVGISLRHKLYVGFMHERSWLQGVIRADGADGLLPADGAPGRSQE